MKYKERQIAEYLKEWVKDPHRSSAYQLQQKLDYFAAQYIGPALLRLKDQPQEDRAALIKEESRKCKHFSEKCLHFLVHQIFDEQHNSGQIDLQCSMDLQKTQLLCLDTTDSVALKKSLLSTGYKMLELGANIERARIESLLHTYCLIYYFHRWDGEVAGKDDALIMDEVGRALLKARGLAAGKSTIYETIKVFEAVAEYIATKAPPSSVLSNEFQGWFKLLIMGIADRSQNGTEGFSDLFHQLGCLPGFREYGNVEEEPAAKKPLRKTPTPESIAQSINEKLPKQRTTILTKTFNRINDTMKVIELIDITGVELSRDQISTARENLKAGLSKLDALDISTH